MNDIQKRLQWEDLNEIRPMIRPGGRTGAGAQNHCAHGRNEFVETILDWHPFERYTTEASMIIGSRELEVHGQGTRINAYFKLKMPLPRFLKRLVAGFVFRMSKVDEQFDTLVRLIEES